MSLRGSLPHRLNIFLHKLPLHTRIRNLPREACLGDFLHEAQTADRALPIADIFCLDLNQRHAWVFRGTVVCTITQVTKPGRCALRV